MNKYITQFDLWYKQRNARERLFVMLLGFAFLYAVFYFILFRSIDYKRELLLAEIRQENNQMKSWHTQMTALKEIANSPIYKKWKSHQASLQALHKQYENFILPPTSTYWQSIIKTVLSNQKNMTTDEVKYYPPTVFTTLTTGDKKTDILQQAVHITIYGSYFDTINYLKNLEKALPIAQWDKLTYAVTQYPLAKVDVEFLILYEQTS